jgi:hypothetical protein
VTVKAVLIADRLPGPTALAEGVFAHLEIVETVWVQEEGEQGALIPALQRIARGEAAALATTKLALVASSLRELVALVEWLEQAGSQLLCADPPFDTAANPELVGVLKELARYEQAGHPRRKRKGRPGLAELDPALYARIQELAELGLGPKAIADRLNAEGVKTPRGGKRWRPSSVQAALGYRRPPPPLKGAPPPPPHPPGHHPPPPPPPGPPHAPGGERWLR